MIRSMSVGKSEIAGAMWRVARWQSLNIDEAEENQVAN